MFGTKYKCHTKSRSETIYLLFGFEFFGIKTIEQQGQEQIQNHEISHHQRW